MHSQTYTLIDFGSSAANFSTNGNWNNLSLSAINLDGLNIDLIDINDNYTGVTLSLDDSFDLVNNSGTTNPDNNLPFPNSSTKDSFFGETSPFNGNTNPTGGFTLSNLDPNKYYSFSIFSSIIDVTDNRETLYTITGQNSDSNTLNSSNNTNNTADVYNIEPTVAGNITFTATVGANNNNPFGFYYLGAIKMVSSATPVVDIHTPYLSLIYPNGGENWEVGKTVSIDWESFDVSDIDIEYSNNDGNSWNFIDTTTSSAKSYDWVIPSDISNQCLIRISSNGVNDSSEANFSIINDDNINYSIIILGSSTAAGFGPAFSNNAWVSRYNHYLYHTDTRFQIENLARGGFTTYNILPTGTGIPGDVTHEIDVERNITKAISNNADGVIINLPSNDAAFNYPAIDQIANYHLISNTALAENIPVWVSSPQPKNFGSNTIGLGIQLEMVTQTPIEFEEYAFDFWTDLGVEDNDAIKPEYNTDGTHLNDTAHRILFERIKNKGVHTIVKDNVDGSLNIDSNTIISKQILIYPSPFHNEINIGFDNFNDSISSISILDINGSVIFTSNIDNNSMQNNTITLTPFKNNKYVSKGVYYCKIITNNNSITKKIIFN